MKMKPHIGETGFCLKYQDRCSHPTTHAVNQIGDKAGCGRWFPIQLFSNPTNVKGDQLFSRDREDAETLLRVIKNGFRRLDSDKKFLWRVREDGTLRAMLTDQYATC